MSSKGFDSKTSSSHCSRESLTNTFGVLLQIFLACLAFTCLIVKRFCEPPLERRGWNIWFYDISKQGVGALVIHLANIFLSVNYQGDPCTWYIINFLLDSSIGLLIICVCIRTAQYLAQNHIIHHSFNIGHYGMPTSKRTWFVQCIYYIILMLIVKLLIVYMLMLEFEFWNIICSIILTPFKINEQLLLAFVLVIIPFFVNIFIFWVTDNYLMQHKHLNGHIAVTAVANNVFLINTKKRRQRYDDKSHDQTLDDCDMIVAVSDDELLADI